MPAPRKRYIPRLLQLHLDDLAFIASQRRAALNSQRHTLREFGELGERLEAHLQGLLVAPVEALRDLLMPQLVAVDRDECFAAAYGLLRTGDSDLVWAVIAEFTKARGHSLAGLRDALSMAPAEPVHEEMQSALEHAKPITAVAAAAVLANHRKLDPASPRLDRLLGADDPEVAALAWRLVALADGSMPPQSPRPDRPFMAGVMHADERVRLAAWHAAAWAGQSQALPVLRASAEGGDAAGLHWLAVLGTADDMTTIQQAALAMDDDGARCALLARFGHPSALNALVRWMESSGMPLAVAACEAFTRLTGLDIRGERRQMTVPDDADEFDREMAPLVWMPDAGKARTLLEQHGQHWSIGLRWCRGQRLDGEVPRELLVRLDLEARWEVAARAALRGQPISAPSPVF